MSLNLYIKNIDSKLLFLNNMLNVMYLIIKIYNKNLNDEV